MGTVVKQLKPRQLENFHQQIAEQLNHLNKDTIIRDQMQFKHLYLHQFSLHEHLFIHILMHLK